MSAVALAARLGRWGALGFGTIAFVSSLVQALGFYAVAGKTQAERDVFGQQIALLGSRFSVLLAPPVRADTVTGYVAYRSYGGLAILFAVWAMVAASGAMRGDEERGLVEAVLATGLSRLGLIASRVFAFALAALLAALASGAGLIVGARSGGETVLFAPTLGAAVALSALALCCYGLTLLIAQLTPARAAIATSAAVLLALFLANGLSRTFTWLDGARWLSPFRYFELSRPLVPGGSLDVRATLVLVAAAAVASAIAWLAFTVRDVGGTLVTVRLRAGEVRHLPSRVPAWRVPLLRILYERRLALAVWAAGAGALAAILVAMTRSVAEPLLAIPAIARFMTAFVHGEVLPSFVGYFWFTIAELLFAGMAIAEVARWAADDSDGRLGLVLSQPFSRAAVVVERAAAITAAAAVVALVSAAAVGYVAREQGIGLDPTRLVQASLLLVPFSLVFAGAGSLLTAFRPRAAVGVLGGLAFAAYLDAEVGQFLSWPLWLQNLSPFKLFGNPLTDGVDARNLALMVAIALATFGTSILAMQRRDVGA